MKDRVNCAVIGLGSRGYSLLKGVLLKMADVNVLAVCDAYEDRAKKGGEAVRSSKKTEPLVTTDYKEALRCKGVEAVFIYTAWEAHIEIAVEAMKCGVTVAMEVGGAYSLDDCFSLVRTSEETGVPCMMLENCCYGKMELRVTDMARKGVLGEIVHCEGGYCHDLRSEIADGEKNRHYRLRNYIARNCENYPTHELGPIAKLLDVNDGNRMLTLTSFSSKARGLKQFVKDKRSDDKKLLETEFKQGDVVTTIIECEHGETVVLSLDTTLPRPYSRKFTVRGTKGMYQEDNNMVFLDGRHNAFDFYSKPIWNNARKYRLYDSPLWRRGSKHLKKVGHGGMDWLVTRAFVESYKAGKDFPIDVYDTAAYMCVTALSEESIREGGKKVNIPDFAATRKKAPDLLPDFDLRKKR